MAGLDVPVIEGFNNQRKEYLYNEIVHYRPELANTAELLYGDLELMHIRMLNDGTIPKVYDFDGRVAALEASFIDIIKNAYVDVKNYGAKGDGVTDDLPAFLLAQDAAIEAGHCLVYAGAGTHMLSSAFLLKSNVEFFGAGIDKTIIKLMSTASNDTWVVSNDTPLTSNHNIRIHDMTMDWSWSLSRTGQGGGTRSSALCLRFVRYAWVERVKFINVGQHCIDLASGAIDYPYNGDGSAEPNDPSEWIWIKNCIGTGWADDGITTHHSQNIYLDNNYLYDPRERGNCNGIEVDDGSRNIFLTNNATKGCYAGVEVKAHGTANAARNIHINGHYDEESVRSYNFRHIDRHGGADPISTSAFDITCTDLVSVNPNNDRGFQDEATPRALCISAYHRVSVTNMTCIGRNNYGAGAMAISVQFRASASLSQINITGWGGADKDINITTDGWVSLSQINIEQSAANGIYLGSTVAAAQLFGINCRTPLNATGIALDIYNSANVDVYGFSGVGYAYETRADLINYTSFEHYTKKFFDVPAGLTTMKALDPIKNYYISTTAFAACTTDRPTGVTGAFFITHSNMSGDAVIQTITRNTAGLSSEYWRVLYFLDDTAGGWHQRTITAVAYSAT